MILTAAGNYPRISDRPKEQILRRALAQLDDGRIDWAGARRVQDEVVQQVIAEQIEAGLDLVTDGLIRWDDAVTYIAAGLERFEMQGLVRFLDTNTFYREPLAQEPIQWKKPISVEDWKYAASVSTKPVKAVLTGPHTIGRLSRSACHPDPDDLVLELAEALRSEIQTLHEAGVPLVQIDEPLIARQPEDWPLFREAMARLIQGTSGKVELNTNWGSVASLRDLFSLAFPVFGLDLVMGPANWDILDRIPGDKEVMLGIIDAREVRLEEPEEIARSIERASRSIAPERMHLSPNCGLEFLPRDSARGKLQRLVQGAQLFQGSKE